jgi:hypothetical protein
MPSRRCVANVAAGGTVARRSGVAALGSVAEVAEVANVGAGQVADRAEQDGNQREQRAEREARQEDGFHVTALLWAVPP